MSLARHNDREAVLERLAELRVFLMQDDDALEILEPLAEQIAEAKRVLRARKQALETSIARHLQALKAIPTSTINPREATRHKPEASASTAIPAVNRAAV